MPRQVFRGDSRNSTRNNARAIERMTTGQLIAQLHREGFPATRRMLDHAVAIGLIPRPSKVGNWRRWTPAHADAARAYMRDYSRATFHSRIGGES